MVGFFSSTFALLPFIAGFIGGFQYPLATHLLHVRGSPKRIGSASVAGFLYGIDVFGATVGALVTGTVLIPLLGINVIAGFCAVLNGAVFVLLMTNHQ